MATITQLQSLRQALSFDFPPLCSGVTSPSPEGFYLYYGKENPRFVNFASATTEHLELLTAACDPATFGRGSQDVHDESYRKAVKMDASDFSVQLDLVSSGILRALEDQFLRGKTENMYIRAELHKLNIYDKDSFSKPHKDSPRGSDVFGSLVVIFPTAHEGGELILRHEGHGWKFNASSITSPQSLPSLAYVAFYGDVEHEVLKVTSGRRVTLTYNLYLVKPASKLGAPVVAPSFKDVSNLQTTLRGLLKSPEFLPDGGTLGFGLAHLYPVTFETELQEMASHLKGADAHVYQTCRELQLRPSLKMIYDDTESGPGYGIMLDEIVQNPEYDYDYESYERGLVELGGVPVNITERAVLALSSWVMDSEGETEGEFITWISPFNGRSWLQELFILCGSEISAGYIHCSPCLIVRIAPAIDRV